MLVNDILLECGKSLSYLCSCIYTSNANKDNEKRDFFAKYLLDNGISKSQIQNGMMNVKKENMLEQNEVFELYNNMKNKIVDKTINYNECPVLCDLLKKKEPLITEVPIDEFTNEVQLNFDYEFDGLSKYYPYELPKELLDIDFDIMVICGRSGGGKSTLLKEFDGYNLNLKSFDNSKAIVSNFKTPNDASYRLSAVGLSSIPTWCRPRNVLSVGEGFRADLALNLDSYTIFDEFTSTIDRNVAKSTCNSVQKYIRKNNLNHIVFCSCHKDYIPFIKPDIVIDLDEEKVYDCRGANLGFHKLSMCTKPTTKAYGEYLGSFTI